MGNRHSNQGREMKFLRTNTGADWSFSKNYKWKLKTLDFCCLTNNSIYFFEIHYFIFPNKYYKEIIEAMKRYPRPEIIKTRIQKEINLGFLKIYWFEEKNDKKES